MLDFEMLKDAKCGETTLVKNNGDEIVFIGIFKDKVITHCDYRLFESWYESTIKHWSIKKETKKLYQYAYKVNNLWNTTGRFYLSDDDFSKSCPQLIPFKRLDHTMIEVDA